MSVYFTSKRENGNIHQTKVVEISPLSSVYIVRVLDVGGPCDSSALILACSTQSNYFFWKTEIEISEE